MSLPKWVNPWRILRLSLSGAFAIVAILFIAENPTFIRVIVAFTVLVALSLIVNIPDYLSMYNDHINEKQQDRDWNTRYHKDLQEKMNDEIGSKHSPKVQAGINEIDALEGN